MIRPFAAAILLAALAACGPPVPDAGNTGAATRIVTLAPHLAELVYAVGAGDRLVGVSAWSDHPPEAGTLPVVGDAFAVDRERLALLEPDLVLAWGGGMPAHRIDELRDAGFPVVTIVTRSLDDVALAIERIGELAGRGEEAAEIAGTYRTRLAELEASYGGAPPLRVFYQVSKRPLYTVSGEHYISELIGLCGGRNIFAGLEELAPAVSVEAVLAGDPEVMLAPGDSADAAFAEWNRWQGLSANRYGNRFVIPGDLVGRATPRLLDAGARICELLDEARRARTARSDQ